MIQSAIARSSNVLLQNGLAAFVLRPLQNDYLTQVQPHISFISLENIDGGSRLYLPVVIADDQCAAN
jgi:hypothetical protein